eukprot:545258-Pyramimonas_sp.AAC.1
MVNNRLAIEANHFLRALAAETTNEAMGAEKKEKRKAADDSSKPKSGAQTKAHTPLHLVRFSGETRE